MYLVALVQNQSEMSHYGYADARPLIKEFGYQPILYTAQNIEGLAKDLSREKFDAIFFASNALNDKTIRENVLSNRFTKAFRQFVEKGKGCLLLHQLRMAQQRIQLSFLPEPLNIVIPRIRGEKEKAAEGDFYMTSLARSHTCFLYPHHVDVTHLKNKCLSFKSLKGLYWHYWGNINESDWNILLYDRDKNGLEKPLIVSSKEFEPFRIVLCALTLDWQKQKKLLHNILVYVVEGRHDTAILKDTRNTSVGFEYLIESLRSQKYPFRVYDVDQSLEDLKRNIENGIHTILLVDPFINETKVDKKLGGIVRQYVNSGKIKFVKITQENDLKRFYIAGREKCALRLLHDIEIKVQNELFNGYIDGSFWSTVESLQILNDLKSYTKLRYDKYFLEKVLQISNTHDREGSYDEVFGVSCALLWLRAISLGVNHPDTQRTLSWIRNALPNYEDREKVLAYYTFLDIGVITREEKESLKNLLLSQQNKLEYLSEIDLIVYLKTAVKMGVKEIIVPIIMNLYEKSKNGYWIDLATTATATTALLDSLRLLQRDSATYSHVRDKIESMIFKSIIYIQNSIERESKNTIYPWDNKASTSLKCIQAWLNFEEMIDLPVNEIIEVLRSYSLTESSKTSTKTSLVILNDLREQNRKLTQKLSEVTLEVQKYERFKKQYWHLLLAFLATIYILLSITIYSFVAGTSTSIDKIIEGAFVKGWPFHIAFLSFVASLFGVILLSKQRRR